MCTMLRKVLFLLFLGSVCAFWDVDSDNYRDSRVDDHRDYNSNDDLHDNDSGNYKDNDLNDDLYDNDSDDKNRFPMGGFGRRTWGQQRSFGFQPRRRQQVSRFNPFNRRSGNSGSWRQRPNLWNSFQTQPQRRVQSQPQRRVQSLPQRRVQSLFQRRAQRQPQRRAQSQRQRRVQSQPQRRVQSQFQRRVQRLPQRQGQNQPQRRVQSQSRFNRPTQSFSRSTQNFFQPQRNVFGGKNNFMKYSYYVCLFVCLFDGV